MVCFYFFFLQTKNLNILKSGRMFHLANIKRKLTILDVTFKGFVFLDSTIRFCCTKSGFLRRQLASVEREKQRWEKEKSQLKASIEENKERMLKLESYWIEAQTLCHTVNEHLKEAQAQYQALEKKYNKAKKLIKDFQQK